MTLLAPTLQAFFTDRLTRQLQASPRTIASYRDTLRLLLCFTQDKTGKHPAKLDWDDLNETVISAFLEHLETDRHNTARTRNLRLTAIRSLFKYAALRHPEHASVIAQVLSIPPKRHQKRQISFLTADESQALIDAPDQSRWEGRRDRAMLTLTIQAGLRVSELIALNTGDIQLGTGAHVRCEGKGRKQRTVPLTNPAQAVLTTWLAERAGLTGRPAVRDPHRAKAQPRRDRATRHHPRRRRHGRLPLTARQTAPSPRPAPQLRDVAAASRSRHHRHRPLARARRRPFHPALPPRRPHDQRESPRPRHPRRRQTRPLQAARHTCSRSSKPCDYADKPAGGTLKKPAPSRTFPPTGAQHIGIVAVSAQVDLCGYPHRSTSSATSPSRPRPPATSSKSSADATNTARSSSPPTAASPAGARSSTTRPSRPRSSTACSTTAPSSPSTGPPTGCADTKPASKPSAMASKPQNPAPNRSRLRLAGRQNASQPADPDPLTPKRPHNPKTGAYPALSRSAQGWGISVSTSEELRRALTPVGE